MLGNFPGPQAGCTDVGFPFGDEDLQHSKLFAESSPLEKAIKDIASAEHTVKVQPFLAYRAEALELLGALISTSPNLIVTSEMPEKLWKDGHAGDGLTTHPRDFFRREIRHSDRGRIHAFSRILSSTGFGLCVCNAFQICLKSKKDATFPTAISLWPSSES